MKQSILTISELFEIIEPLENERWFITFYNDTDNHFYITNEKGAIILRTTQHATDTADYFHEVARLASAAPSMGYHLKQYIELLKQANEILYKCWDSLPDMREEIEAISGRIVVQNNEQR